MIIQNLSKAAMQSASSLPIATPAASPPVQKSAAHAPVAVTAPAPQNAPASQDSTPVTQSQAPIDVLAKAVAVANDALRSSGSALQFTIDSETETAVVTMVDSDTGEVIRQFPSEEALAIARSINEMLQRSGPASGSGMLYKQTA